MDAQKLARINALARKSRIEPLSPEELQEQAVLRMEYRQAVIGNLRGQLDHITVVYPGDMPDHS